MPMCGDTDLDMLVDIVQCRECGLTIAKDSAEEAIAAWNTRHGEDKLQERIDALEWMFECDNFNIGRCKNADAAHECIATREAARAAVEKK